MRHHLAIAACLVVFGSIANASPSHHRHRHHKKHRVAIEETLELRDDVPVGDHGGARDWHLAIGPYVWASSVDANVSLGSANVGSSVDFLQTTQHAKFGAELLADARYRRLSLSGDLMYGVVGLEGGKDDTETFATQFVITPWVGVIREPVAWQPDGEEIEKVIEVPVAALLAPGCFRVEQWERHGVVRDVYFYDHPGAMIWGATARILKQFLDLIEAP